MRKKKLFLIMITTILVVFSFTGSVAYYKYVYTGNVNLNISNVVFNVSSTNLDANTQKINLGSNLKPGSSGIINITFDSTGSDVDMYVTFDIKRIDLPDNLKFYYTETHNGIINTYYSLLDSSKKNDSLTIYWYWNPHIDDVNDSKYINKTISAKFDVSSVQISDYAVMKNGYSEKTEFWSDTYRPYIRTVYFGNDLSNLPSSCTESNLCWNISESGSNKNVYAYLLDSGLKDSRDNTQTLYNLYIVSEAPIFAPSDCTNIFSYFYNLISIDFNNNFNTSSTTNMDSMFASCSSLVNINLSGFNTSKVINMHGMFDLCSSLTDLDLNSFNTSSVTDMKHMFDNCASLVKLDLSSFNTSNVTDMFGMFSFCLAIEEINLNGFNTSNVTTMQTMFGGCKSLITLDLSDFNTSNVTNMGSMFSDCSLLTELDLSNFDTSNVTDMGYMFDKCSSLKTLNLSSFNTSKVTTMGNMFYNCSSLTTTIKITNKGYTYYGNMFTGAATDENALITVDFIDDTSSLVDSMIATKSSNSNVVLALKTIYAFISSSNNGVDTNIDFSQASSSSNGDGINIVSGTESNDYPIYYYRGNVTNNNIIYAGFCWKIVRTTETGGVKLVYNGVSSSGKCTSTGEDITIGASAYNTTSNIMISNGYMYGNMYGESASSFLDENGDFSKDAFVTYTVDMSIIDSSNTGVETIGTKTFNIAGRHTQNALSSDAKKKIDIWYQNNILNTTFESMLEDTVWCNDRSYTIEGITAVFSAFVRNNNSSPSLSCSRAVDKFTVSSLNGNGDLEYPIGMLTLDEIAYAGVYSSEATTYLSSIENPSWSMTPSLARYNRARHFTDSFGSGSPSDTFYIRPAVSLKNETKINTSGDGTSDNPFVIVE